LRPSEDLALHKNAQACIQGIHLFCLFAWGLTALSAQIGYIAP